MSAAPPEFDDVHEWVSFEDPDRTWLLDVTFLTSAWQCIWDTGCPGVCETLGRLEAYLAKRRSGVPAAAPVRRSS